jgi:lysophospholipase L1-like esterase
VTPIVSGRRTWIAVAVVVALIVGAVALWPRSHGPKVAVVGDSITVFARHDLNHALDSAYDVKTSAVMGQRIDQMLAPLQHDLKSHPRAVVVNLGTNDVLQARLHPDWRTGFNAMIALVASTPCVVLTTISTLATTSAAAVPSVATDINAAIIGAAASHPNFHVLDWNGIVHGPNGIALLIPDRIHPSGPGSRIIAASVRHILDTNCATVMHGRAA